MNDTELVKLIGQGGALLALSWIVWRIGERMIQAIDRVGVKTEVFGEKIDHHTKTGTTSIGELRQDLQTSIGELRQDLRDSTAEIRQSIAIVDTRMQQFAGDWVDQLTPASRQHFEEQLPSSDGARPLTLRPPTDGRGRRPR